MNNLSESQRNPLTADNSVTPATIRKHYRGIDRWSFLGIMLLFWTVALTYPMPNPIVAEDLRTSAVLAGVAIAYPEANPVVGLGGLVGAILLCFLRYKNIGRSGWRSLGFLVPFVQISVLVDCYSLLEGYQHTKKMDVTGLRLGIMGGIICGLSTLIFPSLYWRLLYFVIIAIKITRMVIFYNRGKVTAGERRGS